MSGGRFDYNQYRVTSIAEDIEHLIAINESGSDDDYFYSPEVIKHFKEAVATLHCAFEMAQRIDWLVSGDDGEESFLRRWQENVLPLQATLPARTPGQHAGTSVPTEAEQPESPEPSPSRE